MYTNIDSFLNKRDELNILIKENSPKIIAITEIKAKNQTEINHVEYALPGYNMFINKKPDRGVVLYADKTLGAKECPELDSSLFQESVWCYFLDSNNEKILIGCVYRNGKSSEENNQELFNLLKANLLSKYDKICIMGDFNYPKLKWDGSWAGDKENCFVECLRDAYLIQMVTEPTRARDGQQANILDLVIVNEETLISNIQHLPPVAKSDHEVLFFSLYISEEISKTSDSEYKYDLSKDNFSKMRKDFANLDWKCIYGEEVDVENCWIMVKDKLLECIENNIPKKKVRANNQKNMQWMNRNIRKSVKKKYNLYKRYLRTRSDEDYKIYAKFRNSCGKLIKKKQKENTRKE